MCWWYSKKWGVITELDEVPSVIEGLTLNKACGPQRAAEHLKYDSHRISVVLAMYFNGLSIHCTLPDSMLTVLLMSVVKDKTGKTSSVENYRPTALVSILSWVLEQILLNRLLECVTTTDNQFGFKSKHGTDMYICKERNC